MTEDEINKQVSKETSSMSSVSVGIDLDNSAHALGEDIEVRCFGAGAIERKRDIICRQGGAVTELDALAQIEAVLRGRHLAPRGRQTGFDFEGLAVVVDQRLKNGGVHAVAQGIVLRMNVQRGDVAGAGPLEGGGLGCRGHQQGSAEQTGKRKDYR